MPTVILAQANTFIAAHAAARRNLLETKVFPSLSHVEEIYPGFRHWYFNKAIAASVNERAIFIATQSNQIFGVAIAKRSDTEKKLCTIWVKGEVRRSRVAFELGSRAFDWLGTDKPLFTVPEELIADFRGLLRRWDFNRFRIVSDYYRPGKKEYVFNGQLTRHVTQ